ncbi:laminin EGF-like protein [Necator americanus]|uniref:Laminin EGF-like protein n=1 Tax=Necator americanus TaxID=51031 RepID=W2T6A2_NECAM|nr:laminin EGF-like protein [Necator americanus]ETN77154.1 laminin EGF-like protein [Necator americanus]
MGTDGAVTPAAEYYLFQEKSTQSIEDVRKLEVQLIDARNIMRSRLQYCTAHWRDEDSSRSGRIKEYWHKALHKARTSYPDSITCLMELKPLLQKHKELRELLEQRKIEDDEKISAGLDAFLTRSQVQELRYFHENGDSIAVEEALDEYFEGLPSSRKNALISEFLDYESKLKRVQRDTDDSEQHIEEYDDEVLDPEQLKPEWLAWQTPRHKKLISKMIIGKANKWEVMNEIGDQFYHLRKEVRQQYKEYLQHYCIKNLKNVIGETNFNVLRGMYMDTDPVEQIETKFHELVAELHEERERLLADHYAVFCRKIFRLVHFEPTDLTIWLTSAQKFDLGQMIQNPDVNDTHIYDKMYEFYLNTTGEAREEAKDIIESGCRHFIEHMFGDDNAEELEELRLGGTISKQHLAARLAAHAFEVTDEMDRKRAEGSLSICSRIYLGYDGSCECHGHATSCDSVRHNCLNCTDNTYGVQCELCMESFTGDPLTGGCTPVEHEETSCTCNNHSSSCDPEGKCQSSKLSDPLHSDSPKPPIVVNVGTAEYLVIDSAGTVTGADTEINHVF